MRAILLVLVVTATAAAQQIHFSGAHVSTALLRESTTGRVSLHNKLYWTQPVASGSLTNSIDLARTAFETRNGRTAFEWRSTLSKTAFAKAGAFSLTPLRFENRSGNVSLPSVPLRGFQTGFAAGRTTVGIFSGNILLDDGPRGWATRRIEDSISGVYLSRALTGDANFAIEADRQTSGNSSMTIIRPSFRWAPAKGTAVTGEYAAPHYGKPSFHLGIEVDKTKAVFNAAYVRHSRQYLSLGPLASFANREGLAAETRLHVARWLELSVGGSDLHMDVDRRKDRRVRSARQYSAIADVKLSPATHVIVNRQSSAVSQQAWSWLQITDSATLLHTRGRLSTRLRVDRSVVNFAEQSLGVELEGGSNFLRTALSGRVRWQNTQNDANRTGGMSASVRGSRSVGKRLSVAVQAELTGQTHTPSWAYWNQRSLTSSVGVLLSKSAKLSVDFFRIANSSRPSPRLARTATAAHTVYLEFEKSFP